MEKFTFETKELILEIKKLVIENKRILLGTAASLAIIFLLSLPFLIGAILFLTIMSTDADIKGAIYFSFALLVIYLICLYYPMGLNIVWRAYEIEHKYRKRMLFVYCMTLLFRLLDLHLILFGGLFFSVFGFLGTVVLPAILGRWLSTKLNPTIQKCLAWIPFVLLGAYCICITIMILSPEDIKK